MILFESQVRPNQFGGDEKGVSAPHEGICLFGLGDGSVRSISENIDATIYNTIRSARDPVAKSLVSFRET
jgi:hypothetical protein